jgi:peptidylprolyl isomerase
MQAQMIHKVLLSSVLLLAGSILYAHSIGSPNVFDSINVTHFFHLPLDTSRATHAPMVEERDSSGLTIIDIAYGKGEVSSTGRRHFVRFIGYRASTMEEFSTEFAGKKVFAFIPDSADVFPGFKLALRGMRVGGRRRVIVPPHLGYGARGRPSVGIRPNETLIIDLELVKLDP